MDSATDDSAHNSLPRTAQDSMPYSSPGSSLRALAESFRRVEPDYEGLPYRIPTLWLEPWSHNGSSIVHNPARWMAQCCEDILNGRYRSQRRVTGLPGTNKKTPEHSHWYMLLPRHFTAYDHGQAAFDRGWSRVGTLCKTIAVLPYLCSLGVRTIVLLPLMQGGRYAHKGRIGSVYAIANPTELDLLLSEPACGLSIDEQFQALVEAAHACDIQVIQEFALRTTSRDADWVAQHPEWYYWVREEGAEHHGFHPPHFRAETLREIERKVQALNFQQLPEPDPEYRALFCTSPVRVQKDKEGQWLGVLEDGTRCRIPGAFADYPPDDTQPLWSDVSYLRLHTHPQFNYVAYNTVRMYDADLDRPEFRSEALWERLQSVIPDFIRRFNIDGAVLDMSHSLPAALASRIIAAARSLKPEFVFVEENFHTSAASREKGFDAVLGNWWYRCTCSQDSATAREELEHSPPAIPFLACPDTHNSPRLFLRASRDLALHILEWSAQLPQGIRCTLAGTEFGCTQVMNTGLGFSPEETQTYPADDLPLFSDVPMDWDAADPSILRIYRNIDPQ